MSRSLSFKGVIIAIIAFFIALMVVVWVIAERADPKMVPQSQSQPKRR